MDQHLPKEQEFAPDLESGTGTISGNDPDLGSGGERPKTFFTKLRDRFMSVDENLVRLGLDQSNDNGGSPENVKVLVVTDEEVQKVEDFTGKKMGKEKRKKVSSAKKPPKPPRPPRGFSLDAADQKLIKELAELAMIKRARIERLKALKQKKALKASSLSSSSSSSGSFFALIFTIIFFVVIFFQGMSCHSKRATFPGSPQTAQTNENGLIFIQENLNPSASNSILPDNKASRLVEKIRGSDFASKGSRASR